MPYINITTFWRTHKGPSPLCWSLCWFNTEIIKRQIYRWRELINYVAQCNFLILLLYLFLVYISKRDWAVTRINVNCNFLMLFLLNTRLFYMKRQFRDMHFQCRGATQFNRDLPTFTDLPLMLFGRFYVRKFIIFLWANKWPP